MSSGAKMFYCKHENCDNTKHEGLGYCRKHYQQFRKHGKTFINTSREFNEIIDKGNYYELVLTSSKMEEVGRTKIDKEDLEKVKMLGRWHLTDDGYAGSRGGIKMHRVVMDAEKGYEVDHIKVGAVYRLDNRKKRLRIATSTQNKYNKNKQKNNTSGFKGVSWIKASGKWRAQIQINGKNTSLGLYATAKEASEVYEETAKKIHKEFYYKNKKGA